MAVISKLQMKIFIYFFVDYIHFHLHGCLYLYICWSLNLASVFLLTVPPPPFWSAFTFHPYQHFCAAYTFHLLIVVLRIVDAGVFVPVPSAVVLSVAHRLLFDIGCMKRATIILVIFQQ